MAVGDSANMGWGSYLFIGRETSFKTYATCTAGLRFISHSMSTTKESKILEHISTDRTYADRILLGKTVEGEIEAYAAADSNAFVYLLQNAFGGGNPTSATGTGETTGGLSFEHQFSVNNFDATYSSISINARKGNTTTGKIFEYNGVRVNEMTLSAEIDEALKATFSLVGCDSTITANDVSANVTATGQTPLSFVDMRFSVETAVASLTTTSFWHVQNLEFMISNNLKTDSDSRRIGSDTLQVMPAGMANLSLKATVRFDTTTAFDAMNSGTRLAAQAVFQGPTLAGSSLRQLIQLDFPCLYVANAGDPEVGGPDEILSSEIEFHVMRDKTASGYAVKATVRNLTSSY